MREGGACLFVFQWFGVNYNGSGDGGGGVGGGGRWDTKKYEEEEVLNEESAVLVTFISQ